MAAKRLCGRPRAAVRAASSSAVVEPAEEGRRIERQAEAGVRLGSLLAPAAVAVDQVPERDMLAAFGQEQVAGPQRVAKRQGQRDLPDPAVDPTVLDEEGAPGGRHEATGIGRLDCATCALIESTKNADRREQRLASGRGLQGQCHEVRQVLAQRAVAREHSVEIASVLEPGEGAARRDRLSHGRSADPVSECRHGLVGTGGVQGLDRAEHAFQAVAGPPAQTRSCASAAWRARRLMVIMN